jgi:hypothetical protein
MTAEEIRSELEGTRVESASSVCLYCGGHDAVLLGHHCKDELELYCDWCERWTGHRIRIDEARAWVEPERSRKAQPPRLRLIGNRFLERLSA